MNRDAERIYDEFLVTAAQGGDRAALSRLLERWQPRLLAHAWRYAGDVERAKDAVQDAWIEILRGLARLDDPAAFPAWACRIVSRRCQRVHERIDRQRADPLPDDDAPTAPITDERDEGAHETDLAVVKAALADLPAAQRTALALFHLEGLSVAEIAIATDVAPGTVKTRLMHARSKLRAVLHTGDPT